MSGRPIKRTLRGRRTGQPHTRPLMSDRAWRERAIRSVILPFNRCSSRTSTQGLSVAAQALGLVRETA